MRTSRVSAEDQYRLIIKCRRSGLSDQQWCMNHDIKPGTFYNWVKRLRQRGYQDIPAAAGRTIGKSIQQEVVRIERNQAPAMQLTDTSLEHLSASMELSIGNLRLKIPNGTDLMLLSHTIKVLSEFVC